MNELTLSALSKAALKLSRDPGTPILGEEGHPCKLGPLGRKHKTAILNYWEHFGLPAGEGAEAHLNTLSYHGRFLLIQDPIFLKPAFMLDRYELDWLILAHGCLDPMSRVPTLCPKCGNWMFGGEEFVVTPFSCHHCGVTFWTFCNEMDSLVSYDLYVEMSLNYEGDDPWGEKGIPLEIYNSVRHTAKKAPKNKKVTVNKVY